jgi:hypothetical protein
MVDEQPAAEPERTPCSFPVCDDGPGEPCDRHEREQSHAEGSHELCGPECAAVGGQDATQPAEGEAREALFRRVAGSFVDEARANALLDAYRAEVLREAADRVWALADRTSEAGLGALQVAESLRRMADESTP